VQPMGVVMFGMRGRTNTLLQDDVLIPAGGTGLESITKLVE
jgi:hypothetical protein